MSVSVAWSLVTEQEDV